MGPAALMMRDHCCWHRQLSLQRPQSSVSLGYLRHPPQFRCIQRRTRSNYAVLATFLAPNLAMQAATVGQLPRREAAAASESRSFVLVSKSPVHHVRARIQQGIRRLPAAPSNIEVASAAWSLWDPTAVTAASAASFKLLFLCGVIAWMCHRRMIPPNASQVLSQVAFSVTIPAMLLVSTTKTLMSAESINLLGIPLVAVLQIALGAVLGRCAAAAVQGKLGITRALCGWHDLHPTAAAAAIAASAAAALRAPMAAPALLPRSSGIPPMLPLLIQLGCSFGNTVTLPLLYLTTMLSATDAVRAAGFMSLFHAAWSPCLWVFGYSRLQEAGRDRQRPHINRHKAGPVSSLASLWRRILAAARSPTNTSSTSSSSTYGFSPPASQPAVLITKQLPPAPSGASPGAAGTRAVYAVQSSQEEEDLETPAEQLLRRIWRVAQVLLRTEMLQKARKAINPPVAAVLAGVTLGLSPASVLLCDASAAAAYVTEHSSSAFVAWELSLLLGILRCCWETVEVLASGTLALQALVLGASLFSARQQHSNTSSSASAGDGDADDSIGIGPNGEGSSSSFYSERSAAYTSSSGSSSAAAMGTVELMSPGGGRSDLDQPLVLGSTAGMLTDVSSTVGTGGSSNSSGSSGVVNLTTASAESADDASASVLQQLKPQVEWEWRVMLAVAAVRFVLLPSATCVLVLGARAAGMLPVDPVCAFMLLLQSCMPPAQNLVLMMQLQPATSSLAPATARLLLQMYTLAVLPVTLWVSIFAKLVL